MKKFYGIRKAIKLNAFSFGGMLTTAERALSQPNFYLGIKIVGGVAVVAAGYYGTRKTVTFVKRVWDKYSSPSWEVSIRTETKTTKQSEKNKYVLDEDGKVLVKNEVIFKGQDHITLPDGNVITRVETCNHFYGCIARIITGNKNYGYKYLSCFPLENTTVYQHERTDNPPVLSKAVLDKSKELRELHRPVLDKIPPAPIVVVEKNGNISVTMFIEDNAATLLRYNPNTNENFKVLNVEVKGSISERGTHALKKHIDEFASLSYRERNDKIKVMTTRERVDMLSTLEFIQANPNAWDYRFNYNEYSSLYHQLKQEINTDDKHIGLSVINIEEDKPSVIILTSFLGLITGGITYIYRKFIKPTDSAKNNFYKKK